MPSFYFIAHNRNHVRLMWRSVVALQQRSHVAHVIDAQQLGSTPRVSEECRRVGLRSYPLNWLRNRASGGDFVIVGNDWDSKGFVELLKLFKNSGVVIAGLLDGCRWADTRRYRLIDHVLAYGPAALRSFSEPVRVVGSPVIEDSIAAAFRSSLNIQPFVLINHKEHFGTPASRETWLRTVLDACAFCQIKAVITAHPSNRSVSPLGSAARQEFSELIGDAAIYISSPSTTVLEALALGKIVILYPVGDELLLEFAEPRGAFEIPNSPQGLVAAIEQAMRPDLCRTPNVSAFLGDQLSRDPLCPAWQRIATALDEIAAAHRSNGAEKSDKQKTFCVRAFESNSGLRLPDRILCRSGIHNRGHCVFGPDHVITSDGIYRATFEIEVDIDRFYEKPVMHLDVFQNWLERTVLAERRI